ncbi:MAG: ribose-5-phosphate isomerase RpiA [Hyphomicrobiaceae bacterium]
MDADAQKRAAAEAALELIEDGMKLGLGTGSTAEHFVDLLGARVKEGLKVTCVPTSQATHAQAEALGIKLVTLDDEPALDLTIDGADEIDANLCLIKGGGGALLREKIVAAASGGMVVIAHESKVVEQLGKFPLPIEVVPFGLGATLHLVGMLSEDCGCSGEINLRLNADGQPFTTDGGHYILDCSFGTIPDPEELDQVLRFAPGVVETGLFVGVADIAIVAGPEGVTMLEAEDDEEDDEPGNSVR